MFAPTHCGPTATARSCAAQAMRPTGTVRGEAAPKMCADSSVVLSRCSSTRVRCSAMVAARGPGASARAQELTLCSKRSRSPPGRRPPAQRHGRGCMRACAGDVHHACVRASACECACVHASARMRACMCECAHVCARCRPVWQAEGRRRAGPKGRLLGADAGGVPLPARSPAARRRRRRPERNGSVWAFVCLFAVCLFASRVWRA